VEVTSFVSPRAVPQLADAGEVFAAIAKRPATRYPALVPNLKGMERAIASGVRDIAVFTAASEGFTRHNIDMSIDESLRAFAPVVDMAQRSGIGVRGYVSTAFGCPYDGPVAPAQVAAVTGRLFDLGVDEVSIGDTIGVATPGAVRAVLDTLLAAFPAGRLAVHFHDTRGTALANVLAALECGIATVDAAAGGLGGCPYAPGASGNLATEDLLYMLHGMGIETGVDLDAVTAATLYLASQLGSTPTSKYVQSRQAT
jgi:isopropylmalate/homocitrate/citramalate synthase